MNPGQLVDDRSLGGEASGRVGLRHVGDEPGQAVVDFNLLLVGDVDGDFPDRIAARDRSKPQLVLMEEVDRSQRPHPYRVQ